MKTFSLATIGLGAWFLLGCSGAIPEPRGGRPKFAPHTRIYDQGWRAHDEGVPSNSNPYSESQGGIWINGWMDAAKQKP